MSDLFNDYIISFKYVFVRQVSQIIIQYIKYLQNGEKDEKNMDIFKGV